MINAEGGWSPEAGRRERGLWGRGQQVARGPRGRALGGGEGGYQFGDLDGVEGGALAEVVAGAEERQTVVDRIVAAEAADVRGVLAGGKQRGRDVFQDYAGSVLQEFAGALRGHRPGEAGVHLQRVSGKDRYADAGTGDSEIGDTEDLAALAA